jgi:hypothetical protein
MYWLHVRLISWPNVMLISRLNVMLISWLNVRLMSWLHVELMSWLRVRLIHQLNSQLCGKNPLAATRMMLLWSRFFALLSPRHWSNPGSRSIRSIVSLLRIHWRGPALDT